ncbi:MAG: hypothetical protein II673_02695 [Ruminococcus sp.]|nr:hypothetical protein [Ruminococcus sp.]
MPCIDERTAFERGISAGRVRMRSAICDGSGYNCGLKGKEIPLTARIIGIADAFDAMTSNRVYRPAMTMDRVIEELKNGRGTQFDPELVDILLGLVNSGRLDVSEIKKQSEELED